MKKKVEPEADYDEDDDDGDDIQDELGSFTNRQRAMIIVQQLCVIL